MKKFGFVFPGQGSQKLGMLKELAQQSEIVEQTFRQASEVIELDLWEVAQLDSGELLDQTHITQPLLLAASVAIWRLWNQAQAPQPSVLAGHSLGEYSALVCAGVMEFTDAVSMLHQRGQFMQTAVPLGTGKMAAILGLDNDLIDEICQQAAAGQVVSAANFNSPGQTVIAGDTEAVERAMVLCKDAGAKRALPLKVSVPSHCALMKPAADKLEQELLRLEFSPPSIPVVQNVNAAISTTTEQIKQSLVEQLISPVLWADSIQLISKTGVSKLLECGPGKVLGGLTKRIDPELSCFASDDPNSLENARMEMTG